MINVFSQAWLTGWLPSMWLISPMLLALVPFLNTALLLPISRGQSLHYLATSKVGKEYAFNVSLGEGGSLLELYEAFLSPQWAPAGQRAISREWQEIQEVELWIAVEEMDTSRGDSLKTLGCRGEQQGSSTLTECQVLSSFRPGMSLVYWQSEWNDSGKWQLTVSSSFQNSIDLEWIFRFQDIDLFLT